MDDVQACGKGGRFEVSEIANFLNFGRTEMTPTLNGRIFSHFRIVRAQDGEGVCNRAGSEQGKESAPPTLAAYLI